MLVEEERRICRTIEDCQKEGRASEALVHLTALGVISTQKFAYLVENKDQSDEDAQSYFVRQFKKRSADAAIARSQALFKSFSSSLSDVSIENLEATLNSVLEKREGQVSPNQFIELLHGALDERKDNKAAENIAESLRKVLDERDNGTRRILFLGTVGSVMGYIVVSVFSVGLTLAAIFGL